MPSNVPTFALAAVMSGAPVTFLYRDKDGVVSVRRATFRSIHRSQAGHTYVRASDLDRKAPRTFGMRGILAIGPDGQRLNAWGTGIVFA